MSEPLSPLTSARVLRAKAHELEAKVSSQNLAADIALVAHLLADFIEHVEPTLVLYEAHTENLIERVHVIERHLWPEQFEGDEEQWDKPRCDGGP